MAERYVEIFRGDRPGGDRRAGRVVLAGRRLVPEPATEADRRLLDNIVREPVWSVPLRRRVGPSEPEAFLEALAWHYKGGYLRATAPKGGPA